MTYSTSPTFVYSSGNVGIGTVSPAATLDVTSTTSGFLPPRMTATQEAAIASPVAGMVVYNTSSNTLDYYNGTSWMTPTVQPQGSTANVYPSGPPASANLYTFSAVSANFTPSSGTLAGTDNGIWLAEGATTSACLQVNIDGTSYVTYDLGSNKSIGNIYWESEQNYAGTAYSFLFSTDGVTFANAVTLFNNFQGLVTVDYETSGVVPAQTARYIRVMNSSPGGAGQNGVTFLCQVGFGP